MIKRFEKDSTPIHFERCREVKRKKKYKNRLIQKSIHSNLYILLGLRINIDSATHSGPLHIVRVKHIQLSLI